MRLAQSRKHRDGNAVRGRRGLGPLTPVQCLRGTPSPADLSRTVTRQSVRDAEALWIEELRTRGRARLTIAGSSMAPELPDGCLADVEAVEAADVSVGDIVVLQMGAGLLTHRILACHRGRSGALLLQCGDASSDPAVVTGDALVGRVVCRIDGGDRTPIEASRWRANHRLQTAYGAVIGALLPFGRWLRRCTASLPNGHLLPRLVGVLRRVPLLPFTSARRHPRR